MTPCRWLRWKGSRDDRLAHRDLEPLLAVSSVPFSCGRTCQAWGPDDQVAAPEACGEGRSCFEGSRRLA